MSRTESDPRCSCERLSRENASLKEQLAAMKRLADSLSRTVSDLQKEREETRKKFEDELAKKDATISGLKKDLKKAKAIQNHDGINRSLLFTAVP